VIIEGKVYIWSGFPGKDERDITKTDTKPQILSCVEHLKIKKIVLGGGMCKYNLC
jgi:hypothetical protein